MIYFDSTLILTDVLYHLNFLAVGKHGDDVSHQPTSLFCRNELWSCILKLMSLKIWMHLLSWSITCMYFRLLIYLEESISIFKELFFVKVIQLFSYIIYLNSHMYYVFASIFSYLHKQRPTLLANRKDVTLKWNMFSYHHIFDKKYV